MVPVGDTALRRPSPSDEGNRGFIRRCYTAADKTNSSGSTRGTVCPSSRSPPPQPRSLLSGESRTLCSSLRPRISRISLDASFETTATGDEQCRDRPFEIFLFFELTERPNGKELRRCQTLKVKVLEKIPVSVDLGLWRSVSCLASRNSNRSDDGQTSLGKGMEAPRSARSFDGDVSCHRTSRTVILRGKIDVGHP